jgi:hypothetical protein
LLRGDSIETVSIQGDVAGGDSNRSGKIFARDRLGSIEIGGSILGGSAEKSGIVQAGELGQVLINGDVRGGSGRDSGAIRSQFGLQRVEILGSVIGGEGYRSGLVAVCFVSIDQKDILQGVSLAESIVIHGDVQGGSGSGSGQIFAGAKVEDLRIMGSVIGHQANLSGRVHGTAAGSVLVQEDVVGGSVVFAHGSGSGRHVESLTIAGTINGGRVVVIHAGTVSVGGDIIRTENDGSLYTGTVTMLEVAGSLIGGGIEGKSAQDIIISGSILGGDIRYLQSIGDFIVSGSLVGGVETQSGWVHAPRFGTVSILGNIENSNAGEKVLSGAISGKSAGRIYIGGSISAAELVADEPVQTSYVVSFTKRVDKLLIDGEVEGNESNRLGLAAGMENKEVSGGFGAIKIGGSVAFTEISAGFQRTGFSFIREIGNPDAQIGKLMVDGNWTASSVSAGTQPGTDGLFGTEDDDFVLVNGEETPGLAAIAKVVIRGELDGTSGTGDHFGFVAGRIGTVSINGLTVPLTAGQTDVIDLPASTKDVTLRELRDQ